MTDVLQLLEHDHREVEEMFAEIERASDPQQRKTIVEHLIIELVRHAEAEEQAVYPMIRKHIENGDATVDREIREHSEAEELMKQLEKTDPTNREYLRLVHELAAATRSHIAEEEGEVFPQFRQSVNPEELDKLGDVVEALKKIVPTRPHPMAPDTPPWNALLAPGAGLVDRVRDAVTGRGRD